MNCTIYEWKKSIINEVINSAGPKGIALYPASLTTFFSPVIEVIAKNNKTTINGSSTTKFISNKFDKIKYKTANTVNKEIDVNNFISFCL